MKEKTADSEGHRIKVDQQKSLPSPDSVKESTQSPESSTKKVTSKEGASKNSLPCARGNNSNQSNTSSNNGDGTTTSNANNNNFDDDCEWGDISIGDLIIDLDADIERQSEGDKNSANCPSKSDTTSKKSAPETDKEANPSTNPQPFLDLNEPVMSSNLKSNRLTPLPSTGSATAHTPLPVGNNSSALVGPVTPNASNTNGATSSGSGHHHHGHNQRPAYSLAANNTNNSSVKNSSVKSPALVEHHATVDKGLKMKIKRKNIGGKISETKHEIVSSDISLQSSKPPYTAPFDSNSSSNNLTPNAPITTTAAVTTPAPTLLPSSTNSALNSVILALASPDGVQTPLDDASVLAASKLSKHSIKLKSGHRDKKDKIKPDNEKHNFPPNSTTTSTLKPRPKTEDPSESASSTSSSQSGIPNLTLKYSSTPSPTVIMKPDETNRSITNAFTTKKTRVDDVNIDENISESKSIGTSTSVASITEPDCLGPCEPGTSVTLEGIVWQETEGGVLVVNVTWRGKTYVGTLLDCTKHDWAPPRLCDSPTSDIESKSLKNTRGKRARNSLTSDTVIDTRSVTSKLRNGKGRRTANSGYILPSPAKGDSLLNPSKRKGRPSDLDLSALDDSYKRNRASKSDNSDSHVPTSPVLIECPEPNCSKKYKHINGLKYHQSHAHFGSTFNINDSQDFGDTTNSETNAPYSAKDDASDDESNNMPEFCLKDSSNNFENETANKTDHSVPSKLMPNTLHNSQAEKLNNCANIQLIASDSKHQQQTNDSFISSEISGTANLCNKNGEIDGELLNVDNTEKPSEMSKSIDIADASTHGATSGKCSESSRDSVNISRDVIFSSNAIDLPLTKSSETFQSKLKPSSSENESNNKEQDDVENVASPAYSDISDDTNLNDNSSELASSATQPLDKTDPSTEIKKSQALNNFSLSSYPPYFNQPHYNPQANANDSETKDSVTKSSAESNQPMPDLMSERPPPNPYSYPHYYRLGAMPSQGPKSMSESISKLHGSSLHSQSSSSTYLNRGEVEQFAKDKTAESIIKPLQKESEPSSIMELQNLKNRIQFDQGSLYDQKRFISDSDKDKSKDKPKHLSPQHPKPPVIKEEKDKSALVKVDEGVKPTMETTGPPPPPTNGYNFLNSPFMQYQAMSSFENMLRSQAMNHIVMGGSPYGHPPNSFMHPQMRFPNPLGGLQMDGLPLPNSVPRSSAQSPSTGPPTTTTSSGKAHTSHHLSSASYPSSKSDRMGILSPTTNSGNTNSSSNNANMLSSASFHKSPSKDFPGGMIPLTSAVSSAPDQRTLMTTAASSLHPPRHPFSAAHVGYPMFDPYNTMMVNHAANSVPMHPFTPK